MNKSTREFSFGLAALIISFFALAFTGLQWYESREMRHEAHETRIDDQKHFDIAREDAAKAAKEQQAQVDRSAASAERSARSAEKSTDTASESLRLNRQIFQASERAFVHVKSVDFVIEPNKPAKVTVHIENAGRTTAKGTRAIVNMGFSETPLTMVPPDGPLLSPVTPMDLVAGDARGAPLYTSAAVSEEDITRLKNGSLHLYAYGHIEYKDMLAHPRKTTFCFEFNKDDPSMSPACPFSNTAD